MRNGGGDRDEGGDESEGQNGGPGSDAPAELPIDGVLDLHQFQPREAADLVSDYLDACTARGIRDVRVVHGKGLGNLRRIVHAALARHPAVESFGLASDASGWGATLVRLRAGGAAHGTEDTPRTA